MIYCTPIVNLAVTSFADMILEVYPDEICKFCESTILGQSSNSQHFQCEGCKCGEAVIRYMEE